MFLGVLRAWGWRIAGYGVLIGVLIGVWMVRPVSLPSPEPGMPNVLLVVIDSLRTDRISSLGYPRQTTENLDKILASGNRCRIW